MTTVHVWERGWRSRSMFIASARATLLALLVALGALALTRPAAAAAGMIAASATADAGLSGCSSNRGKALYDCVANVLDRLNNEIARYRPPAGVATALGTAASQLRAATTKAQALSAITQCQAAIAGALREVRATGGGEGLSAVAGVLARAARLIQVKG
jgi:hypothetical protein